MSSAVLYLAIVAIWAFLLVPRWLRRSHPMPLIGTGTAGHDDLGTDGQAVTGEDDAGEAEVSYTETEYQQVSEHDQAEPDTAPIAPVTVSPDAGPAPAQVADDENVSPAQPAPRRPVRPPVSRSKILQARRRLLTILVLLAGSAATCTTLKLTSPWVCVPPAVMLGMYLLLLREAAIADAETARDRAEQAAALARRRAQAQAAKAASTPQPTAEIIDISARLVDQLYDQYADAAVRAVGD